MCFGLILSYLLKDFGGAREIILVLRINLGQWHANTSMLSFFLYFLLRIIYVWLLALFLLHFTESQLFYFYFKKKCCNFRNVGRAVLRNCFHYCLGVLLGIV